MHSHFYLFCRFGWVSERGDFVSEILGIRHWFIQKSIKSNCPIYQGTHTESAVYTDFCPTVSIQGHEWIKVYSADDLQKKIGMGVHRYSEIMSENERLKKIIAKELNENDELECEYTYVCILKQENSALRSDIENLRTHLLYECKNHRESQARIEELGRKLEIAKDILKTASISKFHTRDCDFPSYGCTCNISRFKKALKEIGE